MPPSKKAVLAAIHEHQSQLQALHVARLRLFGSVARDEAHQNSDIDLIVEFVPGYKTYNNFIDVADLLETALQRRVELVTSEGLSPYIRPHILREVEDVFVGS
jgi:hypothetical protein